MKKTILFLVLGYILIGTAFASQYYLSYKFKPVTSFPNNLSTFISNTFLWPLNNLNSPANEIVSSQQESYIVCPTATTTDDFENTYLETKCSFAAIHTGDAFLANVGYRKWVVFTYNGTPSEATSSKSGYHMDFDTEQENAWEYKIMGSKATPKKLTFKLWNEHKKFSDISGFSFRDLNFDGYFDLVEGVRQGSGANFWSDIYWFDPSTDTFNTPYPQNYGSVLDGLDPESNFDIKNRTYSHSGTSGPDGSYMYSYEFLNDTWILTQMRHSEPDDTGKYCVEEEGNLINVKMVETKKLIPREENEHC